VRFPGIVTDMTTFEARTGPGAAAGPTRARSVLLLSASREVGGALGVALVTATAAGLAPPASTSAAGRGPADARQRPGLALIAMQDSDASSGTTAQHRAAAEATGAEIAELADVGHW
jgi:hypothetical protein